MTALIDGFLNVSRLETGKIHLNKANFEIDLIIKGLLDEMAAAYPDRLIQVGEPCGLTVFGDCEKISQVIHNLLTNANKYSPNGKPIITSCKQVGNMVQVCITDQGIGITKEDQKKLFNRYFRIKSEATKSVAGFGLGLYLCSEIIQRHGGEIWVESEQGYGSTFCFAIPFQNELSSIII